MTLYIWRLGMNVKYRTISHLLGVGLSSLLLDMNAMRHLATHMYI